MRIRINDQMRTSRGQFPVESANVELTDGGRRKVSFVFSDDSSTAEPVTLEDLAGCLRASYDLSPEEICDRIAQFARRSGPLFGVAGDEAVSDWQLAISASQEALRMQQQVNGTRPWSAESEHVVKTRVTDADGNLLFTYYSYFFVTQSGTQGDYSGSIPKDPWVKTFGGGGSSDYLYAKFSDEGDFGGFDIYAIACPAALSPELLVQTLCFLNDARPTRDELVAIGADKLVGIDIDELAKSAAAYELDDAVTFETLPMEKADAPHVQHIVQAMAALHLRRVTIDLFKTDDTGDSLAFDTYLNSLWYGFATRLGAVKVGYCQECGAGFSLTGHRGLPKQYCSDECRTKAKNRRERNKVETVREMYMSGESIESISKALYPSKAKRIAAKDITATLAKWPRLKQEVKKECAKPGDHPFAHRCCADGIISERQLELLENRSRRMS